MSRTDIVELLQVPTEDHDLDWLQDSLQWAVDLELATIPTYLSGLWSIKEQSGEVYNLIDSVIREEMLHMGLACNMVVALGGTPEINAPTYPGALPGGVRPEITVSLAGLSSDTVQMYMQIEMPEQPLALEAETFPTIGAFYDAISAAFTALQPSLSTTGQLTATIPVPDPDHPEQSGSDISETLDVLSTLTQVQAAIATIKDQGEGTSQSPDAPQFDSGELAHYYRFGEIFHGQTLVQIGDGWQFAGDPVPFPDCYPVASVPAGGYPDNPAVQQFDQQYAQLLAQLRQAWSGGGTGVLGQAIGTMFELYPAAAKIISQPLPGGSGNYGPDFRASSSPGQPAPLASATPSRES
ncbi:MAG: hypothetical protein QOF83_531 [Solirubrobacteraceae bacterium]|jgi:hypothetical protein|nr:hypothetical protein [Solirubrobacteraceae bacterium]